MLRNIKFRLLLSHLLLVVFALVLTGFFFLKWVESYILKNFEAPIFLRAGDFRRYIGSYLDREEDLQAAAQYYVRTIGVEKNLRLRVLNARGHIILDTLKTESPVLRQAESEALSSLTEQEKSWVSREGEERFLHVSAPIYFKGIIVGGVDVSTSLAEVDATYKAMKMRLALAFGVSFLAALALALFLIRTLMGPIRSIQATAGRIAAGDLTSRVSYSGTDELGKLGETINHMAGELEQRLHQILQEKNKMTALLSSLSDGVIALDLEGKVTFLNESAAALFGVCREGAPAGSLEEIIKDETLLAFARESLGQKKIQSREIPLGEHVLVVFAIPFYEGEKRLGSVLVCRDVTELRRLEAVRSEFIGNVSHELRTPLTIIKGFVITLLDSGNLDDEWRRHLDRINRETDRLTRLVDELLDLSHLRSKKFALKTRLSDPGPILRQTAEQFKSHAGRYGIELLLNVPEKLPQGFFDPDRLGQVLINLLDNAFKFTPEGGKVTLSARSEGENLVVEVADEGSGIPEEELPYLFERFFRAREAGRRTVPGMGIGLSIVKEIVEAHSGTISVNSRKKKGTTFTFTLPLRPGAAG